MSSADIFFGEDLISAPCQGLDIQELAAEMRASDIWEEVVPGMADITVKYDPGLMSFDEAKQKFESQYSALDSAAPNLHVPSPILLTANYDGEFAPDAELVAKALHIPTDGLPEWLSQRHYHVSMMGFQPGFTYLEDSSGVDLPALPRLKTPRQRVAAGSIGFLGNRACIYAHDGPGGWPIIGRVREALFNEALGENAILLSPGQPVRFTHGD